jgi:hypothetical protein
MPTTTFTRLSSGAVLMVNEGKTESLPGNCRIKIAYPNRIHVVYDREVVADFPITNTIVSNGATLSGTAEEIVEDLATDIFFLASSGGAGAWGDITGTLSDQTDLDTALDAKAGLDPTNIQLMQALGSTIKAEALTTTINNITAASSMTDGAIFYIAVWLPKAATITGVKFWQAVQGNFTADNENAIGLFTYSGGTLTQVAKSANDGNIWKGTAQSMQSVPFATPYVASAGLYYIGILYNTSAQTTAPTIGSDTGISPAAISSADFTNSAKIIASITAQTALHSSVAMSALSNNTVRYWVALY